MPAPQGTNNPGTKDRGTPNRTKPAPRTDPVAKVSSPSGSITLKVNPSSEGTMDVFRRLLRERKLDWPLLDHDTVKSANAFLNRIETALRGNPIKLYFIPTGGYSWTDIRKNSTLIYTNVSVQSNVQVAEKEKRLEAERLEDEEIAQEEADRRAENERRESEEQFVEEKIKKEVEEIVQKTKFWEEGTVTCRYVRGDRFRNSEFLTMYSDTKEHKDTSRAKEVENSSDYRREIELALWKAYRQQSEPVIHKIPKPREEVEDKATDNKVAAPPTPPPAQTIPAAQDPCDALLAQGKTQEYIKCMRNRQLQLAEDVRQGTMKVAEPIATGLEIANPLDPTAAVGGIAGKVIGRFIGKGLKIIGVIGKGNRQRHVIEWVSQRQGSRRAAFRLEADLIQYEASQKGHHVYEYLDKNGSLLYVGKSGGVQGPPRSWVDRLQEDHINASWIGEASLVRVSHDITEQEMWALEHVLIPTARANRQPGQYYSKFQGGDVSANAASALKQSQAVFPFEAIPVRSTTP